MKFFKYASSKSYRELYDIFKVIKKFRHIAIKRYGDKFEDVLDDAFEHIIKNYDSNKGELENYASKVISKIGLNKTKEIADCEQTNISLDSKIAKEYNFSDEEVSHIIEDSIKLGNINDCITYIAGSFVKDFKFFSSKNPKDKKIDYSDLKDSYSSESIINATKYLMNEYSKEIERFISYSRDTSIRDFNEDRYLKSIDNSLEYKGNINDIILLKRRQGSHVKKIYRVNIKEVINSIINLFYTNSDYGKIDIEGVSVYLSLSGKILDSIEDLIFFLEKELVGSILSRTSLKVLKYKRGNEILLSSTKEQNNIVLPIFNKSFNIQFERMVIKEV